MEDLVARARRWGKFNFDEGSPQKGDLRKGVDKEKEMPAEADKINLAKSAPERAAFGPDWLDTHVVGRSGHVVDATPFLKAGEQASVTTKVVSFTEDDWGKVIGRAGLSHKDATKAGSSWMWSAPGIKISSVCNPATKTAPGGAPCTCGSGYLSGDKSKVEMCLKDVEKYGSEGE